MAKGQKRSSREPKKPKAEKPKTRCRAHVDLETWQQLGRKEVAGLQ